MQLSCNNLSQPGPDVTPVLGRRDLFPDADAASRALAPTPSPLAGHHFGELEPGVAPNSGHDLLAGWTVRSICGAAASTGVNRHSQSFAAAPAHKDIALTLWKTKGLAGCISWAQLQQAGFFNFTFLTNAQSTTSLAFFLCSLWSTLANEINPS